MSVQTPPTLLTLARQALLRDEALAISDVEKLPVELFPALFKEAFTGRHTKITTAVVAAWPFPCLPVGALMKTPDLETFQAVLAGVDMQLKRRFQPRRGKLQVLNLRKEHHDFWSIWAGAEDGDCSAESLDEAKQVAKVSHRHAHAQKQRLTVAADFHIGIRVAKEQTCFLQWALQRKDSIEFCCRKIHLLHVSLGIIKQILNIFPAEHVEELDVNVEWSVFKLAHLAPYFSKMRNLRRLCLSGHYVVSNRTRDKEEKYVSNFLSQFSSLNCLQHLSTAGMYFLRDHMNQVLGCLMTPLETLSITYCQISQSDLDGFSQCQKLFQLRHLDLSGVILLDLDLTPLCVLLENTAHTLQSLDLKGCRMTDPQLADLIPALSQCCQLTRVGFYDNYFSMPILMDFLQHSAKLRKMNEEQYPAPLECYYMFDLSIERFTQLCAQLMDTLKAIRQPKTLSFGTIMCHLCCKRLLYPEQFGCCSCRQ